MFSFQSVEVLNYFRNFVFRMFQEKSLRQNEFSYNEGTWCSKNKQGSLMRGTKNRKESIAPT